MDSINDWQAGANSVFHFVFTINGDTVHMGPGFRVPLLTHDHDTPPVVWVGGMRLNMKYVQKIKHG